MIRKDGRNVLRTPSLAETVMQPPDFPYTKHDIALAKENQPYQIAKAHWLTPRAQESGEDQDTFLERNGDRTGRCFGSLRAQTAHWPTATASDGEKGGPNSHHGNGAMHLASAAVKNQWPTPRAQEPGSTSDDYGLSLREASISWPTPMANANTNRQTKPTPTQLKGEHGLNLAMVAVQSSWPTPRTCAGKRSSGGNRTELVNSWATPQAHDVAQGNADRVGRFGTKAGGRNLTDEGVAWATPMTRDWKDGAATSENVPTNSILGRQAPRSMKNGNASTLSLNPLFVEWLMGWPIGWTDCASAVMALSRWLQLMRFELLRLQQASTSDQLDLFAD